MCVRQREPEQPPFGLVVKSPSAVKEMQVLAPGWEDPLGEEMAIYSSILAWRLPWTEEPGGPQSMGSQRRTRLSEWEYTHTLSQTPSCPPSPAFLTSRGLSRGLSLNPKNSQHALHTSTMRGLLRDCASIPMTRWWMFFFMTWLSIAICFITQFSRNQEKLRKCLMNS